MSSIMSMFSKTSTAGVEGEPLPPVPPVDPSVMPPEAPPAVAPVPGNFEQNKANRITIDIYGKNDPAYGGDVLFITMSDPTDFPDDIPANSTPLNKSNYNILNAFINEKLSADFKNAFNKNLSEGTKSTGSTSTLGNAKADIIQRLNNGTITDPLLKDAIAKLSKQLQELDKNKYPDTDKSDWRNLRCNVNYEITDANGDVIGNWNQKDINTVYDLIRGKDKSQSAPVELTNENQKNFVVEHLGKLKDMITPDDTIPKRQEQTDAITMMIAKLDKMDPYLFNNLLANLTYMFGPVDKNTGTSRIEANKYRHLFWDNDTKLFYTKSFDWRGNAQKSTSPLDGNELQKKLTTYIRVQMGGKTKKHNKLHKKQRKTNKK